ncbi:AraC family transcriptional regulator [Paenibacillus sp.]|uniref:helix-turn-helix transcriptional regulator n=1 Tax=Paenibacillus sp. TaxID=58172 RepID=UPI002D343F4F|nr:AraC family transcriptional regulator [Paenibacillus sp.]HZG86513.1 AraC family transcriptional regulator [Paenibacillus sp.]
MKIATLKENRIHGEPHYPVSTYRITCPPNRPLLDLHWHDELEFLLVTEGRAAFRVDAAEYELTAGEAIFVNGGELHSGRVVGGSPVTFRAVVFGAELFGSGDARDKIHELYVEPLLLRRFAVPAYIGGGAPEALDIAAMLAALFEANEAEAPMRELTTKGLLHLCLAKLLRLRGETEKPHGPEGTAARIDRLKAVIEHIEANCEGPLPLRELAAMAGMSEAYFCRFFKKMTALTPVEYVNTVRVQKAAELLRRDERKIMAVAMDVGFNNLNHFNRLFKRRFQCTPSAFRRRLAGGGGFHREPAE